jgi:hypothetical protein
MELRDEKITLTTGKASIVLDGSNVTIQADKGIRFSADKDLKIKGTMVFLNCGRAAETGVSADKQVDDRVRKLDDEADRTKTEILKLLNKEEEKKVLSRGWGFMARNQRRKKPRKTEPGLISRGVGWFFKKGEIPDAAEGEG